MPMSTLYLFLDPINEFNQSLSSLLTYDGYNLITSDCNMYSEVFYGTANVKCDVMLDNLREPRIYSYL